MNDFKLLECREGYGHSGHWCGPTHDCWLDPRDRAERNLDFEDRQHRHNIQMIAENLKDTARLKFIQENWFGYDKCNQILYGPKPKICDGFKAAIDEEMRKVLGHG